MKPNIDQKFLGRLRKMAMVEGVSTLILFGIAMPLKYAAHMPLAVTIVGSLHGVLFIALVIMFVRGRKRIPISRGLAVAGITAAVIPFGPFVLDGWLARTGNTAERGA